MSESKTEKPRNEGQTAPSETSFFCPHCNTNITGDSLSHLDSHYKTGSGRLICPMCVKTTIFKTPKTLQNHYKTSHTKKSRSNPYISSEARESRRGDTDESDSEERVSTDSDSASSYTSEEDMPQTSSKHQKRQHRQSHCSRTKNRKKGAGKNKERKTKGTTNKTVKRTTHSLIINFPIDNLDSIEYNRCLLYLVNQLQQRPAIVFQQVGYLLCQAGNQNSYRLMYSSSNTSLTPRGFTIYNAQSIENLKDYIATRMPSIIEYLARESPLGKFEAQVSRMKCLRCFSSSLEPLTNFSEAIACALLNQAEKFKITHKRRSSSKTYEIEQLISSFGNRKITHSNGLITEYTVRRLTQQLECNVIISTFRHKRFKQITEIRDLDDYCTYPRIDILFFKRKYYLISSIEEIFKKFICSKCHSVWDIKQSRDRHFQICQIEKQKIPNTMKSKSRDIRSHIYRPAKTFMEQFLEYEIPCNSSNFIEFFATFDIETFFKPLNVELLDIGLGSSYTSEQSIILISIDSNLANHEIHHFVNRGSSAKVVKKFTRYVVELSQHCAAANIAHNQYIFDAIEMAIQSAENEFLAKRLNQLRDRFLSFISKLQLLSFNGSRFDLILLNQHGFAYYLKKYDNSNVNLIKRPKSQAIIAQFSKNVKLLDITNYVKSNLRNFHRSFLTYLDPLNSKLYFPFNFIKSHRDFKYNKMPSYDSFIMPDSKVNLLEDEYSKYKHYIDEGYSVEKTLKKLNLTVPPMLPTELYQFLCQVWEDQGFTCVLDYLKFYCSLDIVPTIQAFKNLKDQFAAMFEVSIFEKCTISSLGWQIYCRHIYSKSGVFFEMLSAEKTDYLRRELHGGLSSVFTRLAICGETTLDPHNTHPNDRKLVQSLSSHDFTGLYQSCLSAEVMPIFGFSAFRRAEHAFQMEDVAGRAPLALCFIQYLEKVVYEEHFQSLMSVFGEKKVYFDEGAYYLCPDGYSPIPESRSFIAADFYGCFIHCHLDPSCPMFGDKYSPHEKHPLVKDKTNREIYEETLERIEKFNNHDDCVEYNYIWECSFQSKIKSDPNLKRFVERMRHTILPNPVQTKLTQQEMLYHIITSRKIFGFVEVDLSSPPELQMRRYKFPPLISKVTVQYDQLDENSQTLAREYGRFKTPETQLSTSFSKEKLIISTNLLIYYIKEMGMNCGFIHSVLQFASCKNPGIDFLDGITNLKRQGVYEKKPLKVALCKLLSNSIYGLSLFSGTEKSRFLTPKQFIRAARTTTIVSSRPSGPPANPFALLEVTYNKKITREGAPFPLMLGQFTLNQAKLSINRLVEFFSVYLPSNCYDFMLTDTDSVTVLLSTPKWDYDSLRSVIHPSKHVMFRKAYYDLFCVEEDHPEHVFQSKQAGFIHLENSGDVGVALSAKLAIIQNRKDPAGGKKTMKGINTNLLENEKHRTLRAFFDALFMRTHSQDNQAHQTGMRITRENRILNYNTHKRALNALGAKFNYGDCMVHPTPFELVGDSRFNKYDCDCKNIDELWNYIEKLMKI